MTAVIWSPHCGPLPTRRLGPPFATTCPVIAQPVRRSGGPPLFSDRKTAKEPGVTEGEVVRVWVTRCAETGRFTENSQVFPNPGAALTADLRLQPKGGDRNWHSGRR